MTDATLASPPAAAGDSSKFSEAATDGYYMALTPWQKIAIMLAGFAIVSVTVVAVACTVFPGGCLFPIFCRNDDKESDKRQRLRSLRGKDGEGGDDSGACSSKEAAAMAAAAAERQLGECGAYGSVTTSRGRPPLPPPYHPRDPLKESSSAECGGGGRGAAGEDPAFSSSSLGSGALHAPPGEQQLAVGNGRRQQQQQQTQQHSCLRDASAVQRQQQHQVFQGSGGYQQRPRLDRHDSTYSSMSGTSIGSAMSALSFSTKSPTEPQQPTSPSRRGSKPKIIQPSLTFGLRLGAAVAAHAHPGGSNGRTTHRGSTTGEESEHESEEQDKIRLEVTVEHAGDLPARDYGTPCDPFVRVSLRRDRRSLRKRTKQILAEFDSEVVKKEANPNFNGEVFRTHVTTSDYKNLRVKLTVLDFDRHTKTTRIGSTAVVLKDVKNLAAADGEKIIMTQSLTQKKEELGELRFGVSYLPTAQRLTFNIASATNLKYEEVTPELDSFTPYVRVLQLGPTGRVVKKKKTGAQHGTREPVFNETLNFELDLQQLDSATFLVLVSHKISSFEMKEMDGIAISPHSATSCLSDGGASSAPATPKSQAGSVGPTYSSVTGKDPCLGRIALGGRVRGERERSHWMAVLTAPRKSIAMWHALN